MSDKTIKVFKIVTKVGSIECYLLLCWPRLLLHLRGVEGFSALGNVSTDHLSVSLVPQGTLQVRIRFVRQRFDPTLETNKQSYLLSMKELFLNTIIMKPPEVIVNIFSVSMSVSFLFFPCSKGQSVT